MPPVRSTAWRLALSAPRAPDDAGEIARIQLTTWRHAYRRILPRHVLDKLDEEWLAQPVAAAIDDPPSARHRVLVAVEQAEQSYLVGFAASGPADEAALAPEETGRRAAAGRGRGHRSAGRAAVGRRGHGSRLLAAGVDLWRADGFSTAVAWAFDADAATGKFLTSAGWEPDGAARALDVDDLLVPQLRLHTSSGSPDYAERPARAATGGPSLTRPSSAPRPTVRPGPVPITGRGSPAAPPA